MKFLHSYVGFLIRHKYIITIFGILLSSGGLFLTTKISLETNMAELVPEDVKSARIFKEVKEKYRGMGNLIIVIEGDEFQKSLEFAKSLKEVLDRSGKIVYSSFGPEREFYEKYGLLFLSPELLKKLKERIKEELNKAKTKASPFFFDLEEEEETNLKDILKEFIPQSLRDDFDREYYSDEEGKTLLLFLQPSALPSDIKEVMGYLKDVEKIIQDLKPERFHPSIKVSIGGTFRTRADEYSTIVRDVKKSAIFTIITVFLMLAFFFNQITAIPVILTPLVESILVTSGLTYFVIGRLNFISAFLFAVLLGLGVDFGIHIFTRYLEEREKGVEEALKLSISKTFISCFASGATTSISLFALVFFKFKGFSEFGIVSGMGVMIAFILHYIFLPPLISILEDLKLIKEKSFRTSKKIVRLIFKYSNLLLLTGAIFLLSSLYFASHIKIEEDFSSLRANLPSTVSVKEKIKKVLSLSSSPSIAVTENFEDAREFEKACKRKIEEGARTIDACLALSTFLPQEQEMRLKIIKEIDELISENVVKELSDEMGKELKRLKKLTGLREKLTLKKIPKSILTRFTDSSGNIGTVCYIYPSLGLVNVKNALDFKKEVLDVPIDSGKVYHSVNENIVFADIFEIIIQEYKILLPFIIISIALFIIFSLRHLKFGLLANLPLWSGLMMGLGAYLGIFEKLNLFNLIIIPVSLGIGIDNSIHITKRFMDSGDAEETLAKTGSACIYTTLTTIAGLGGMATAYHEGLESIGNISIIMLFFMLLNSLVFYPIILKGIKNENIFRMHKMLH